MSTLQRQKTEDFGSSLHEWRTESGLTQEQMAEKLGITRSYLSEIENGKSCSSRLRVRFKNLVEGRQNVEKTSQASGSADAKLALNNAVIIPTRPIPVISWAQAGQMMDYEEMPTSWQRTVPTDLPDPDAFAVQIAGDSMEPRYHAGDVAYVTPSRPLQQGDTVIARLANQGVVFKLYSRSGDTFRFSSYNPAHLPFEVPAEEILKIFPVVAVMKIVSR